MCQVIQFPRERVSPPKKKRKRAKVESMYSRPDARTLYTRASRLDESSDPAHVELAERLYREALRIDPAHALSWTNLGNILYHRHDRAGALEAYKCALEHDPEQPEVNYNLGRWYQDEHQSGTAICFYQEAIRLDPSFADAYYNLATAYEDIGQHGLARGAFTGYLKIKPIGPLADRARRRVTER